MHNFADDKTISVFSKDLQELKNFTREKSKGKIYLQSLKVNSNSIEISESGKLFGIVIHNYSNFKSHVSKICKKAAG